MKDRPNFSLVIPTLNAESDIEGLLGAIFDQTQTPSEVLVVDSSSDDRTQEIVRSQRDVTLSVINRRDFDHGGTRHDAFMSTSGEFVCFLTQDAIPAGRRYFESLLASFDDEQVAMVSGRQLPKRDARPFERLVREFNYPSDSFVRDESDVERLGIKAFFASDVCSAYRRTSYMACGGFERPLATNEDMLMAAAFLRNGLKVAYAADAQVYHSHNLTLRQQYERNRQVGAFLESHPDVFGGLNEVGEGVGLVRYVSVHLLSERRYKELAAFGLDCVARLVGNRSGRLLVRRSVKDRENRP